MKIQKETLEYLPTCISWSECVQIVSELQGWMLSINEGYCGNCAPRTLVLPWSLLALCRTSSGQSKPIRPLRPRAGNGQDRQPECLLTTDIFKYLVQLRSTDHRRCLVTNLGSVWSEWITTSYFSWRHSDWNTRPNMTRLHRGEVVASGWLSIQISFSRMRMCSQRPHSEVTSSSMCI